MTKRAHCLHRTLMPLLQMTQERLKEELLMRKTELDKIDMLEEKIKTELLQLAEKSEQMQKQTGSFADVSREGRDGAVQGCCLSPCIDFALAWQKRASRCRSGLGHLRA